MQEFQAQMVDRTLVDHRFLQASASSLVSILGNQGDLAIARRREVL